MARDYQTEKSSFRLILCKLNVLDLFSLQSFFARILDGRNGGWVVGRAG